MVCTLLLPLCGSHEYQELHRVQREQPLRHTVQQLLTQLFSDLWRSWPRIGRFPKRRYGPGCHWCCIQRSSDGGQFSHMRQRMHHTLQTFGTIFGNDPASLAESAPNNTLWAEEGDRKAAWQWPSSLLFRIRGTCLENEETFLIKNMGNSINFNRQSRQEKVYR